MSGIVRGAELLDAEFIAVSAGSSEIADALAMRGEPRRTAGAARAPAQAGSQVAMTAGAKLLWVAPGLHSLSVAPMGPTPSAAAGMILPAVLVVAPNAGKAATVEIVADPVSGNWIGAGGGTLVLRAPPAGGHVLVTAYALPGQATTPLELELHPIDAEHAATMAAAPAAARPSLRSEITLHIERFGDRQFSNEGWAGQPGSKLRIEAFALRPLEGISRGEIEYRVFSRGGRDTPWATDGQLCGTRGQSRPLTGFAVRLASHLRDAYDVTYRGAFFTGGPSQPVRNGEPCLSPVRDDPLEAVEIRIAER
jgi:hypothetical protein